MGKKWPIFGSFFMFFEACLVLTLKIIHTQIKVVKNGSKSDQNGLLWVIFDHLLDHFIYLYLCVSYFRRQLRAYLGETWEEGQKGVQKWVKNGSFWVSRGPRNPKKVDILPSKHQIWHVGGSKNDPFLGHFWVKKWGHFWTPFFPLLAISSYRHARICNTWIWRLKKWSRSGPKMGPKMGPKWVILGGPKMTKTGKTGFRPVALTGESRQFF